MTSVVTQARPAHQRRVLNTGSGPYHPGKLHGAFHKDGWLEVRLDIDARVNPDLVGSITDMNSFAPDHSFDAIWSSHNVEHLHTYEVPVGFAEFSRVLKSDGFALVTCPDLQAIAELIVEGKAESTIYTSPAGPITALDMLFGHSRSIAMSNGYMAHHTRITTDRISRALLDDGFAEVRTGKGTFYDLWAIALMPDARIEAIRPLFAGTEQEVLVQ